MTSVDVLFQPVDLGKLQVPNRIVMAPMTRSFSPGHVPGPEVAAYYRRRAEGDVGLILTEGVSTNIDTATGTPNVPNVVTDEAKAGWKNVVSEVHGAGGRIGLQLWHEGPMRNAAKTEYPDVPSWSPSGEKMPGKKIWEPMTDAEIETAITEFVDAAVAAKELGFDCVEFHGAHSYLLDSFFWTGTNHRDDKWGGATLKERTAFACEIIRRARAAVGPDYPLFIRISQWKQQDYAEKNARTPDELLEWLTPLADAGVDVFHCSQRRFWDPEFGGSDLNFAGWTKKLTGKPSISVGSVGLSGEFTAAFAGESSEPTSLDKLVERLEREEFDLIAVGRALLQDPDWAVKVRDGREGELMSFTKDALTTLS